jgi:asparagine synthase (glutamine-hydrolysing)
MHADRTVCGIAGIFRVDGPSGPVLERMANVLRHRGPDSGGFHERDRIGLAVRRLRIIDLVTGDQPITSACTGATIVYNGELYNYRELRAELEAAGHHFRTSSDTEVALHYYEEYGVEALGRLNGIFAFAIDDRRFDRLVLVRDHLGVKPLYYAAVGQGIAFASEPKALLASGLVRAEVDREGLHAYLTFGHSVRGRTIYDSVHKLAPGHAMLLDVDGSRTVRYWDPLDRARHWPQDAAPPVDEIDELVGDAVRRNMIADVPVGAFLSGGIDSSLVTALMRREAGRVRTYSVGFGGADDELPHALRVADRLGTNHTAILVTPADAARALEDVIRIYDEPFADAASVPTYLMARRAREDVTVVLTGEGGDEVFGGYRRYVGEQLHRPYGSIPGWLRRLAASGPIERIPRLRRIGRTLRALAHDERHRRFAAWTETFSRPERRALLGESDPYESQRELAPERDVVEDDVLAMMVFELRTWLADAYLEKVDKATMAASLEARVPLLDPRIVETMALAPRSWKIAGGRTKVLLRRIAERHVPAETVARAKQGFGPPVGLWLRSSLRHEVDALGSRGAALADLVEIGAVRKIVEAHRRGEWRDGQVWALLVLEIWARERRAAARAA